MLVVSVGCKKDIPVSSNDPNSSNTAEDQPVEPETLLYDQVVQPEGEVIKREFYVENSEPVLPGTKVCLIDGKSSPLQVIVSDATVQNVRWKIKGPFTIPKYPASGFVTITLSENQWKALEDKDIIIKKSKGVK
jgi:hypothetical protein